MLDGEAFGAEIVDLVRGYVERELTPLKAENAELKDRVASLEAHEVRSLKEVMIDRDGQLVAIMSDGDVKVVGLVVGKDGTDAAEPLGETDEPMISELLRRELGSDLIQLPDPLPAQFKAVSPVHVTVENHLPKSGPTKTVVTKHDERGRVLEFERREVG